MHDVQYVAGVLIYERDSWVSSLCRCVFILCPVIKHLTTALFDLQLDAQILIYLYIEHLLKSSTCFEHYPAHLQEVYASGIVTLCRSLSCAPVKKELSFLTGTQDSHLQRVTIPEAAYIYTITT